MENLTFFIINTILVLLLTTKSDIIGKKLDLLDYPSEYKLHTFPIPFIGGIIIYLILLIQSCLFFFNKIDLGIYKYLYISAFFILGLIDDKFNLNSYYKIFFVFLISLILINFDESFLIHRIFFEISNQEFYFGEFKVPITILCILLLYIAMNMSDGINCLLISFSVISLLLINLVFLKSNLDYMSMSILSSLLVMIYFNYKNKIFLGNTGANLLAAYFIYTLISGNYYNSIDVFMVISVFLIMGIDMVRLIFLRLLNKKNPFDRDLNHFHHILLKRFNIKLTIFIYLILSFMPVILSSITKITDVIYIPLQIIIYIILIYRCK